MPAGQWDGARALALSKLQQLRFVVLPDSELNENIVAICGLSPETTTREECGRHAIAILRAVRPS